MADEPPLDESEPLSTPNEKSTEPSTKPPTAPEPGQDSRVEDWMGQSVERDRQLADELSSELGEDEAGERFNELATGRAEQEARHGHSIDPDQGQSAYQDPN